MNFITFTRTFSIITVQDNNQCFWKCSLPKYFEYFLYRGSGKSYQWNDIIIHVKPLSELIWYSSLPYFLRSILILYSYLLLSLPELLCSIGCEVYLYKLCISFLSFQSEICSVIYNITDLTVITPLGDLNEGEGRSEGEGSEDHACAIMEVPSHNTMSVRMT